MSFLFDLLFFGFGLILGRMIYNWVFSDINKSNEVKNDCGKTNTMHVWNYEKGFLTCSVCKKRAFSD